MHFEASFNLIFFRFARFNTFPLSESLAQAKYYINSQDGKYIFSEPNLFKFKIWSSLKKLR